MRKAVKAKKVGPKDRTTKKDIHGDKSKSKD